MIDDPKQNQLPTDKNDQRAPESTKDPLNVDMPYGATEQGGELDNKGKLNEPDPS